MVFKRKRVSESPGGLVKNRLLGPIPEFLISYIFNKSLGEEAADRVGNQTLGTTASDDRSASDSCLYVRTRVFIVRHSPAHLVSQRPFLYHLNE